MNIKTLGHYVSQQDVVQTGLVGQWDRQGGSSWDYTGETVGQIEHWNNSMGTLGMSRELVPLTGGETGAICPGPPV